MKIISCFSPAALAGFCIVCISLFSLSATPPALSELVVETPRVNEKNQLQVQTALASSPGVFVNGYCEERKMFLLLINRTQQPDNLFLDQLMHRFQLEYHVKESCTIAQVRELCGMRTGNESTNSPQ
ncbi:MAG: hypothetical protein IM638_13605 [Bacteroidetes bacterium]|nr:hypothetical protein [Bacteroidota bacterium]